MVQYALSLGGSARGDKKKGFGKYGFGLVTVLGMGINFLFIPKWKRVILPIFCWSRANCIGWHLMYPFKKKGIHTPAPTRPEKVDPPQWVLEVSKAKGKGSQVYCINWKTWWDLKRKDTVENHIKEEVGLTYANFLIRLQLSSEVKSLTHWTHCVPL